MHLAYDWWIALNEDPLRSGSAYKAVVGAGYSTMFLGGTHIMVQASILNDDGSIHVQVGQEQANQIVHTLRNRRSLRSPVIHLCNLY